MAFANFPSLTAEEFEETCHHLDSRYRRATLGDLRSRWKLQLCTSLSSNFSFFDMPRTYIEIKRALGPDQQDLSMGFDALNISQRGNDDEYLDADNEMADDEISDRAALAKGRRQEYGASVTYEIMLHPTYRMPCLYFYLEDLPQGESPFDIDTVFRRLVPDAYREGLRAYGGVGGISIDHHPIHGKPCFFVHPCLTGDNMSAFPCEREDYLTIWIGLTGSCVGLSIPKEMMLVR